MIALLAETPQQLSNRNQQFLNGLKQYVDTSYDPQSAMYFWGAAALIVILLVIIARYFTRRENRVAEPRVDHLVLAVDLLGLSEDDRRDLQGLAREAKVREPAALLLSPQALAHAVASAPPNPARTHRLAELSRRMFGEPLPNVV